MISFKMSISKLLYLAKLWLYFHRVIGITFGGITIDTESGQLKRNNYLIYQGYISNICRSIVYSYLAINLIINFNSFASDISGLTMIFQIRILHFTVLTMLIIRNLITVINLNSYNGYETLNVLTGLIVKNNNFRLDLKVIFIILFWIIIIVVHLVSFTWFIIQNLNDMIMFDIIHVFMHCIDNCMYYSFISLLWLIIIYMGNVIEQVSNISNENQGKHAFIKTIDCNK
jgi:hypothetical protein